MKCTRFLTLCAVAILAPAFLTACEPVLANRGNLLDPERLAQIAPGTSDQAQVQATLGPPTMIDTFDKKIWYYNGKRTERTAFFDPDTLDERTVIVKFNDAGTVEQVQEIDPKTALAITPEDRRSPTVGESVTFMDQVRESLSHPGLPGSLGNKRGPGQVSVPGQ